MKIANKAVLITGGTSGIGYELVKQLAPTNDSIVVISRNPVKLQALREAFKNVITYECSISDDTALEKTIRNIVNNHPDISVVFNNAGIQETPTFLDKTFSYDSIDREISVNFAAPVKICALMLGHMVAIDAPSAFVNISSGLALFPKKSSAVYCATKAAIHSFSKSLRYQLEGTPVAVHEAIMPLVDTPMTEGRGKGKMKAEDAAEAIIKGIEDGRHEIYVGKARMMPFLSRVSPSLMAKIMKPA